MPYDNADFDIKLFDQTNTRKFRLVQEGNAKLWTVREQPPSPAVEGRENVAPEEQLLFEQRDWSWGIGLTRPTPQTQRPGHFLRYADGFNIDSTEPGQIKHGPEIASVGTLAAVPLQALVFTDRVWFLTATHLYHWDDPTLTLFWTNPDGALNTEMEVLGANLFVAASNTKIWHTDGTAGPTSTAFAATHLLQLGQNLWRSFDTDKVSSSSNPAAGSPTWTAGASAGDTSQIQNLFSMSGLLGVATTSSLYIVTLDADSNIISTEINKALRARRTSGVYTVKAESGGDVWFSDGFNNVLRVVAQGFDVFDVRPAGPFRTTDELPITEPDFDPDDVSVEAIAQDIDAIYMVVQRVADSYIYKGVEIARGVFAWSPVHKLTPATVAADFVAALGTSGDIVPRVYFNDGTAIRSFATIWDEYNATWEFITTKFSATLLNTDKLWNRIRGFIDRDNDPNTKITVFFRENLDTTWTLFGADGEMTDNGNNEIQLTAPISDKEIQLRFVGSTTDATEKVDLLGFALEGFLRTDNRPIYDFTVIADTPGDATFLRGLRTVTQFITLTDQFGLTHNVIILPGFPEEIQIIDEAQHRPVMGFHFVAKQVD